MIRPRLLTLSLETTVSQCLIYIGIPIHSTHTSHETSLPETHVTCLTKVMLLILAWQLLQEQRSLSEESDVAEEEVQKLYP